MRLNEVGRDANEPSGLQHNAWTVWARSVLLETSSPRARLIAKVLALLTVAARFSVGEHASSSGDTGAGKLLWLNRPSLSALADIALVVGILGPSGLHGFQGCIVLAVLLEPSTGSKRGLGVSRFVSVEVAFWAVQIATPCAAGYVPRRTQSISHSL